MLKITCSHSISSNLICWSCCFGSAVLQIHARDARLANSADSFQLCSSATLSALAWLQHFQALDMVLLRYTHGWKPREVKMQRPWLTMFGGILILIILIAFGVFNAGRLPEGIPDIVWVFRKTEKEPLGSVCEGKLNPPGLRGMIIAWTDGLFGSWGGVYYGWIRPH